MKKYASAVVAQARAWLGLKESDGSHKQIIDTYNSHTPRARGYKLQYDDPWCAGFVSAVSIECGHTDIMPTECGCTRMIELYKALGCWDEDDSRTPNPGDVIFYDWDDSGKGDTKGGSEHVGIVEAVSDGKITVIEGNYSNSVKRRTLEVNGRYIRGYGVPKYDAEDGVELPTVTVEKENPPIATTEKGKCSVQLPVLKKGCTGDSVKALQILLIGRGYSCGKWGADGDFGSGTESAVLKYQRAKGLTADGIVGTKTWAALLGVG